MDFKIKWNSNNMEFYKYGSSIEFVNSEVHFENELLSPGTVIVRWKSNLNYLFNRTLLQLPLLKRGKTYKLILEARDYPEGSVLLKVDFFDRLENYEGTEVISDKIGEFIYPEKAYSYTISIISVGIRKFIFKEIILKDVLNTEREFKA